jgi:hypothetical protein
MEQKQRIKEAVAYLKSRGIIRFDSQIARALGYTKGAVSEILSPTSEKPVTYSFEQKFYEEYGKHLGVKEKDDDRIKALEDKIENLQRVYGSLTAQLSKIKGREVETFPAIS